MNENPHINIDELYETKQKKDINRTNIYNKLLTKIHSKIKIASRQNVNHEFCHYIMPEVLMGFPNYNFEECLLYIIHCLEQDGFITKYVHPNLLLISWRHWVPEYVRSEIKRKTGKIIDKFGNETSSEKINNINDKLKSDKKVSFENNKQQKINKEYKPSGKFIYDNTILENIKTIIN